MSTRAVEQVDDWDARSFSGGYRGLHDLADEGFSGIVTAGPTRLCMTKGTVVGVLGGTIEDFEDASGTAHEAPSPALPLLAVMQEGNGEVQAQYYTEETPIREVNGTLSDGNFTGFIELSENVLSGDYYVVYHQGRSMSVAYVGNAKQLLTEDEAFQRANDEVGIYEVVDAAVDVTEIPDPAGAGASDTSSAAETATGAAAATEAADADAAEAVSDTSGGSGAAAAADAASETDDDAGTPADEPSPARADADTDSDGDAADADSTAAARAESESRPTDRSERRDDSDRDERRDAGASDASASSQRTDTGTTERRRRDRREPDQRESDQRARNDSRSRTRGRDDQAGHEAARHDSATTNRSGGGGGGASRRQDRPTQNRAVGTGTVGDFETRSIPSLDPDRTSEPNDDRGGDAAAGAGAGAGAAGGAAAEPNHRGGTPQQDPAREPQQGPSRGAGGRGTPDERAHGTPDPERGGTAGAADPAEIERLEAEIDDREDEIERLEGELDDRDERIEELETELEEVRTERDDLQSRIERLEGRIDDIRTEGGGESIADRQRMSPGEAIDGTNLFVRYGSKGKATLENVHDGSATAEDVNANLEIQYHTQFDADDVAVDGDPFDEYLEGTIQYRFVEWVVRVLPYEIRDTGHEGALKDLYDAMPRIDRAELNGTISVVYDDEGEEQRTQESFDVVLRDRMGNPLAVANMNESRDPASQGKMEGLITAAQRVCESKESLAGAFLVTSSFFEPEAMEAASQATGGGLLSRDKRESFVKLSRKEGFHLCLVEAREAQFNLSVPEI